MILTAITCKDTLVESMEFGDQGTFESQIWGLILYVLGQVIEHFVDF